MGSGLTSYIMWNVRPDPFVPWNIFTKNRYRKKVENKDIK